jgi:hypothetical protein
LKITTNALASNETVTAIEYRDIYRGLDLGLNALTFDYSISPNPIENEVKIKASTDFDLLKLVDRSGKNCFEIKNINSSSYNLDLSSFDSGTYTIVIGKKGQLHSKSIIKL